MSHRLLQLGACLANPELANLGGEALITFDPGALNPESLSSSERSLLNRALFYPIGSALSRQADMRLLVGLADRWLAEIQQQGWQEFDLEQTLATPSEGRQRSQAVCGFLLSPSVSSQKNQAERAVEALGLSLARFAESLGASSRLLSFYAVDNPMGYAEFFSSAANEHQARAEQGALLRSTPPPQSPVGYKRSL